MASTGPFVATSQAIASMITARAVSVTMRMRRRSNRSAAIPGRHAQQHVGQDTRRAHDPE